MSRDLADFSFNSYIYYLTRAFNLLTGAFNLLTGAFNLLTRAFILATCTFSLLTREFELLTHRFEFVTCGFEIVTCAWFDPPPLQRGRGGIDFLKFGDKGGDEIFFLEREGLD